MGLFSIFKSHHTSTPDTSAQEAEARRQAEAEAQRFRDLLAQQQAIAEQQRQDAERRYQEQLTAQTAENERQRVAAETLLQKQIDAQTAESARQEAYQREIEGKRDAERAATLSQAQARADAARGYAEGRQKLMDKGRSEVEQAYSGFDDNYFKQFAEAFVGQFKPQAERNYDKARKDTTTSFGDAGTLRSSAAARSFGDLRQQLADNEGKIAGSASDAAQSFRNDIEGQKSDALNLVFSAGGVGSENLPDGVTDIGGLLDGLGAQIGSLTTSARNRAKAVTRPSFAGSNLNLDFGVAKPSRMPA